VRSRVTSEKEAACVCEGTGGLSLSSDRKQNLQTENKRQKEEDGLIVRFLPFAFFIIRAQA